MFKWHVFILKSIFLFVIVFFTNNVAVTTNLINFNENENYYHSHQNQLHQQRNLKYNSNNKLTQAKQYSNQYISHRNDEWANVLRSVASERGSLSSKCVDIPKNFSLCHGIQYTSMRLPNLLDHETLEEAIQQSDAFNSLLRLHCHPDTKLFLCSLFAPICLPNLEKHIEPCQSLCLAVYQGCGSRMAQYGFPWPEMLKCRFPLDNDMCIKPITEKENTCKSCTQVATFENLMDNYCRSNTVLKGKIKHTNATHIVITKTRIFKNSLLPNFEKRRSKRSLISKNDWLVRLSDSIEYRCNCPNLKTNETTKQKELKHNLNFLIMITSDNNILNFNNNEKSLKSAVFQLKNTIAQSGNLIAQMIMPWRPNDKTFKRAIRRFKRVNCTALGREIRESVMKRRQAFRKNIY